MAIKVIAQLREVKIGKNPGKKFVMRPNLYVPIAGYWLKSLWGASLRPVNLLTN